MATRSGSRSPSSSTPPATDAAPAQAQESESTPLAPPSGLDGKLALVLGEMERVAKTGYNKPQDYRFATIGDIADMIRASLASHGVNFHATMAEAPQHQEIRSRSGTLGDRCTVHMRFTLVDVDNPDDRADADWWGHGDDYQDKSIGKAVTACMKSYLVTRFLVSTGEPEPDSGGEQRAAAGTQPEAAPRPITDSDRRRMFALGRELGIEPEFVRLTARLLTRTRQQPHGTSLGEYDRQQLAALESSLRNWEDRPKDHDSKMGRLAAAMEEQAEQTAQAAEGGAEAQQAEQAAEAPQATAEAPSSEQEPEEHQPTCTCGAGPDAPGEEHDQSCSLAIPF